MDYGEFLELYTKDKDLAEEELKNVPPERYFIASCANGHLEVAKWLLSICPTINKSSQILI